MHNPFRWLLFWGVSFTLVLASHVYLYRRFLKDTALGARARVTGKALLWALAPLAMFGRLWTKALPGEMGDVLGQVGRLWLGVSLYVTLALAAIDLALLAWGRVRRRVRARDPVPVSPERRVFLARAVGVSAVALGGGAAGFGVFRAYHPPEVTRVAIRLPRLPKELDGFTLVQLSDLHVGQSVRERWMGELVERCRTLKPDALVVTGDLVDDSVARLGPLVARLGSIPTRAGAYFVTGNHDYFADADAWCEALPKMGLTVLRNRRVEIAGGSGPGFDLLGVDDFAQPARPDGTGYDLELALRGRAPDRAAVLLAHRPSDFDRVASLGVGLQLSGHTHGGQTFPVTALAQVVFERCAGLYTVGESSMYVSRGVGFVGPPLRAGSPPEIVQVTLLAG